MDKETLAEYGEFTLVNILYPDDEGFYKNNYSIVHMGVSMPIKDASSYTTHREALSMFYSYIKNIEGV
jgi:hypothetical protein|tara:strand:+ start:271 stop:474 length:204 start_codon:yes stop_codon:yes gene_type:complete